MKIIFREDSRDKVFKNHFGQLLDLPDEVNFDTANYDDVQPIGNVQCTCYTACDIAEDQTNTIFSVDDLWGRIQYNQYGADPRDVFKEVVSNGLLPQGQTLRTKNWKSYWKADEGLKDKFDNVRSALMLSQSPVGCGTYWYSEYLNSTEMVDGMYILPVGKTPLNGHMYSIEGWKQVNGEPYFIIEAWVGKKLLMSRNVFNEAMKPYGMGAWVLSTTEIDAKRQRTVLEAIRDVCVNVIILMKQLLIVKQVDKPVEVKPAVVYNEVKESLKPKMIEKWAKAIDKWEGNTFGNNPGNLKFSPLIQKFGGKKGKPGSDGGHFAVFDTPEQGFKALCSFLELGCKNQLKSYKNARTITAFLKIYAGSPPQGYIDGIIKDIGCKSDTLIETFL